MRQILQHHPELDLRRTVGTELARLGVARDVRALVFNHSPQSRGVTDAVYNRYAYDKEKREALSAWERHLSTIIAAPDRLDARLPGK